MWNLDPFAAADYSFQVRHGVPDFPARLPTLVTQRRRLSESSSNRDKPSDGYSNSFMRVWSPSA